MSAESNDATVQAPSAPMPAAPAAATQVAITVIEDDTSWSGPYVSPPSAKALDALAALPGCVRAAITGREALRRLGYALSQSAFVVTEDGYFGVGLLVTSPEGFSPVFMGSAKDMTPQQAQTVAAAMLLFSGMSAAHREQWWFRTQGPMISEALAAEASKRGMAKLGGK
jgi:hypothetical protein